MLSISFEVYDRLKMYQVRRWVTRLIAAWWVIALLYLVLVPIDLESSAFLIQGLGAVLVPSVLVYPILFLVLLSPVRCPECGKVVPRRTTGEDGNGVSVVLECSRCQWSTQDP